MALTCRWRSGAILRITLLIRAVGQLGVKAMFVVLTFAGVASLWAAIAADVGASLLVVANALRLLRATP
jgi:cation transport ATPase